MSKYSNEFKLIMIVVLFLLIKSLKYDNIKKNNFFVRRKLWEIWQ